jgi:hypothetical protein
MLVLHRRMFLTLVIMGMITISCCYWILLVTKINGSCLMKDFFILLHHPISASLVSAPLFSCLPFHGLITLSSLSLPSSFYSTSVVR